MSDRLRRAAEAAKGLRYLCLSEGPEILGRGYIPDYYVDLLLGLAKAAFDMGREHQRRIHKSRKRKP